MGILYWVFVVAQLLSAVLLIGFVMSQTTKNEGLTGTIGGKMASSFRGKPGIDDKMANATKWSAVVFAISSMIVYIITAQTGV